MGEREGKSELKLIVDFCDVDGTFAPHAQRGIKLWRLGNFGLLTILL